MGLIGEVDPDCVLVNFECSSNFGDGLLGPSAMDSIHVMLEAGFFLMFSDFAVKGLISTWSEAALGPNPFLKVGEFGEGFSLTFDPAALVGSESVQLQNVGRLAEKGICHVHALGGTVAFTIDVAKADTPAYQWELLTLAHDLHGLDAVALAGENVLRLKDKEGIVGHAMVRYKSGGKILVSCGHWIELNSFDIT